MQHRRLAVCGLALAAGMFVGCGSGWRVERIPSSERAESGSPAVNPVRRGGPPAHAPAVGLRRKYEYVYYPAQQVYYAPHRDAYAWVEGGSWRVGVKLPDRVLIKLDEGVSLRLDDAEPWVNGHDAVLAAYPADWTKPGRGGKKGPKHAVGPRGLDAQTAYVSD